MILRFLVSFGFISKYKIVSVYVMNIFGSWRDLMVKILDFVLSGLVLFLGEVLVIYIFWENYGLWEVFWFIELNFEIFR